ncbi:MAG: sigma-70 family RNA polymerase sigma factor, partial [Rhodospirillales bacterium]|nr:sigma-70 family RNA polymerase sigma factor [Rhodospirillales bacterium]
MTMPSHAELDGDFLAAARRAPVLSAEEEKELALRFRLDGDRAAAERLVTAHLRLVVRLAQGLRGYGLPLGELVAEGNLGLLRALERYEPERDLRFSTYAVWWIRAAMMEYVLRHAAPVSFGLSAERKRLFFKLRSLKRRLKGDAADTALTPAEIKVVAETLNVRTETVSEMEQLLSARSRSLNEPTPGGEGETEWQDMLVDDRPDAEAILAERQESSLRRRLLANAWQSLNECERSILAGRRLRDKPLRLEDFAQVYG